MSERTNRIDELLRQELSVILERDLADPGVGFATITRVETTPDLRTAPVWVSVIGQPAERAETMAALERAMPYARRVLGTRLRIRRVPALIVRADESLEQGTRVLKILAELEAGLTPGDASPAESLPTPQHGPPVENDEAATPPAVPRRTRRRPPSSSTSRGPAKGGPGGRRPRRSGR
jgi:ribosome-binding factor A